MWVALEVSGRGTAQAKPALCVWESLMTDDVGARLSGLGDRASARLVSFNQDNEALFGSEQAGWFRPPAWPGLTEVCAASPRLSTAPSASIVSLGCHNRHSGSGMLVSTMNSENQPNDYRHRR